MESYSYSFSDFPEGEEINCEKLDTRVGADAGITTTYAGSAVHEEGDGQVVFMFDDALETSEETALDVLVAGYVYETLDEAKARCVQECKDWRDLKMNAPVDLGGLCVEYPTSSGKFWPVSFVDQVMWDALNNAKNEIAYPMTRRTWNEKNKHTFTSANEFGTFYTQIRSLVLAEINACDVALDSIEAATDIAEAEAAVATYVGT